MSEFEVELAKLKLFNASLAEQYPLMTATLAAHRARSKSVESLIDEIFGSYKDHMWGGKH